MLRDCRDLGWAGFAATRGIDVVDDKREPDKGTDQTGTEEAATEEAVVEDLEVDDEGVTGGNAYRTAGVGYYG